MRDQSLFFLLLLATPLLSAGQNDGIRLYIPAGETHILTDSLVEIDTLIMGDGAEIKLSADTTTLIVHFAQIGQDGKINGRGARGQDGKPGAAGNLQEGRMEGAAGEDGKTGGNGKYLRLFLHLDQIGSLWVDVSGGAGGDGGAGGRGAPNNCMGMTSGDGGDGGNGGNGGNAGRVLLRLSGQTSSPLSKTIKILSFGGAAGKAGPAGAPGPRKPCMTSGFKSGKGGTAGKAAEKGAYRNYENATFPYPPPRYSAVAPEIPLELPPGTKLEDVSALLTKTLKSCGYRDLRFHEIPTGFAVVTAVEQTDENGKPLPPPHRWSSKVKFVDDFSFLSYLTALFYVREGYFRTLVFLVSSDEQMTNSLRTVGKEDAVQWAIQGRWKLPHTIGQLPFTERHALSALIYEFRVSENRLLPILSLPSKLDGKAHLVNSNIWASLSQQ